MINLHSTPQQIFEIMAKHLLRQNTRAFDDGCLYLAPNGNKCAVGILIPDGHPAQLERNTSVEGIFSMYRDLDNMYGKHTALLNAGQGLHDEIKPINWRIRLCHLGLDYNLDISFLDTPTLTEADYAEMLEPVELVVS